jgi:hypothetical protein
LLRSLAAVAAAVVLLIGYFVALSRSWPAIADPATLFRECEALAADFDGGRIRDAVGRKRSDPGGGDRIARGDWPPSVRALQPPPLFVRVGWNSVTIFQAVSGFGDGWGVLVCLRDESDCMAGHPTLAPTDHPRVFHFQTDH